MGAVITYNYNLKNTGNVTLAGPFTVTDNRVTVMCPATASVAPGVSIDCTATYTVTQADLDAGSVVNTAQGRGMFGTTPVISNVDNVTVLATQTKTLSLSKTAAETTYASPTDVLHYSYVIRNTGNVTLSGTFAVTDDKASVSCTQPGDGALSPNETLSCSASHAITQGDLDAGAVTNRATATGGGVTSNQATVTVSATQTKTLSLSKTAAETTYASPTDVLHYSYVIRNTGNVTLSGTFAVTDDKASVSCTQPGDGALSPNETLSCSASHAITQGDLDAGAVTNRATATGGGVTSNQATVTVSATQTKTLSLSKTAAETTYASPTDVLHYSYVIRNTGNVTLSGTFAVTDDKASVSCTQPGDGALSPNETLSCSASHAITQGDLDAGAVTNRATATGGGVTSNQATVTVSATQTKTLSLSKTAAETTYASPTDVLHYSYVIRNTGNVTLSGTFAVTDDKASVSCTQPGDGALSPNETLSCSASHAITQGDLDAGAVTNRATATGGGVTSNQATVTVSATQTKTLSLSKTAAETTYASPTDVLHYSYVIRNTGNVTLSGTFVVTDDKASVSCTQPGDGALSPNETLSCSASHAITQGDLDAGAVTNRATATGGGVTSNQATVTVSATQTKTLSLSKTAAETTYASPTDVLHYSYVIRNTGNVTLSGTFAVTDDKASVSCTQPGDGALSPNETLSCSASHAITQGDLDAGAVTNRATATGGGVTSNQATVTVSATQTKTLSLSKTAAETTYASPTDVLHYSYVIRNTGNVTLSGTFAVTDDKASVSCTQPGDGALSPNETLSCSASHAITQGDLDAGAVTNRATATGGGVTSNQATVTVSATQTKTLSLSKTATPRHTTRLAT